MDYPTAIRCIDWIFANVPAEAEFIEIGFIGGEPLLEFDLMKRVYDYTNENHHSNPPYLFFATTNGTCLTEAQKKWFADKAEKFALTLSIDGTAQTHNYNRCGSYEKIDLEFFSKTYGTHAVKMTLSEYSLTHLAENIKHVHSLGFKRIAGVNLFEGNFDWSDKKYERILWRQLTDLVTFYVDHAELPLNQMLDMRLDRCEFAHDVKKKRCGIGVESVFFDTDGTRYPCPFVTPMTFSVEELLKISSTNFSDANAFTDDECFKTCYLYPACPTCAGANFMNCKSLARRDRRRCRLLKMIALFAAEVQARRIAQGCDGMDDRRKFYTIQAIKKIKTEIAPEFDSCFGMER